MMIRKGFVTNSSSTNYIIISKKELTPESLAEALGVNKDSILYSNVLKLTDELINGHFGFRNAQGDLIEDQIEYLFGEDAKREYLKAEENGNEIVCGYIYDDDPINAGFAQDCYKIKTKDFYINFTNWGK